MILDDSENFFIEDVDVDEVQLTKKQKGGQTLTQTRSAWTTAEERAIGKLFAKNIQQKIRPTPQVIKRKIQNNALLKGRSFSSLKNKIYRMC